jgi:DNA-binding Lrp family transcriptional regulator
MAAPDCDAIEARVLEALLADGRASLRSVADSVGVAATTVSERLGALEERGVVRGFAPLVDYDALGYYTAVLELRLAGDPTPTLQRICEVPALTTVHEAAGATDVYAVGRFTGVEALGDRVDALSRLAGVERVATNVVLTTPVRRRAPPLAVD